VKQKIINLYEYHELSESAKRSALQNVGNINVDDEWWEFVYMDAEDVGVKIKSFDTYRMECNIDFILNPIEVSQNIINKHGETCDTYKVAACFMAEYMPLLKGFEDENHVYYEDSEIECLLNTLEEDFLKDLSNEYLSILTKEYDYLMSEEAIVETIELNEHTFTELGELEN
jgi:hypothetical protein